MDGFLRKSERTGAIVLVVATILVAFSIMLDGSPARALNGLAGLTWFAGAAILGRSAWRTHQPMNTWAVCLGVTAVVAFVAKPSDLLLAALGFGGAGFVIALIARRDVYLWALLIVGLYLPLHIGTAIGKAMVRELRGMESSIRSDPPPTAAIVPLAMIVFAVLGASVMQALRSRRGTYAQSRPT